MPRRRPSAVRQDLPVRRPRHHFRRPRPPINRLSGACRAHIRRLERTRFRPGDTAEAFSHWAAPAHGPLRRIADPLAPHGCGEPGCCGAPEYFRDHLEAVLHALPKKSARELRGLVRALDAKILRRARIIRAPSLDVPWWRNQL
ncbi:hypothetical protein GCM10010293_02660 [Streptomyces griseoflavus]|nr:hypothetical protein GCM10010293_02660 [Streptomyces griseoflavus]